MTAAGTAMSHCRRVTELQMATAVRMTSLTMSAPTSPTGCPDRLFIFAFGPVAAATRFRESQVLPGLLYIGLLFLAGHVLTNKSALGAPYGAPLQRTSRGVSASPAFVLSLGHSH